MTHRQRKPSSLSVPLAIAVTFGFSTLSLSGCGQGSQTPLPELTRIPRPLMNPAEQKRAIREGIPYQTLISSVLHKYVTGILVEE